MMHTTNQNEWTKKIRKVPLIQISINGVSSHSKTQPRGTSIAFQPSSSSSRSGEFALPFYLHGMQGVWCGKEADLPNV